MDLPPLHNTTEVPAVRSRFDDFLAVHVFQTPYIHNTVSLACSNLVD